MPTLLSLWLAPRFPLWSSLLASLYTTGNWMKETQLPHFSPLWKSSPLTEPSFLVPLIVTSCLVWMWFSFQDRIQKLWESYKFLHLFGETLKNCVVPVAQFPVTLPWNSTSVCFERVRTNISQSRRPIYSDEKKSVKICVSYGKWQVRCIILLMVPWFNDLLTDFLKLISLQVRLMHCFL